MNGHDDAMVAAVFRAALMLGIATPADLVPWADEQVIDRDRPPEWVLDLCQSTGASAAGVCRLLEPPSTGANSDVVFGLLLGLVVDECWTAERGLGASRWVGTAANVAGANGSVGRICDDDGSLHLIAREGPEDWAGLSDTAVERLRAHADPTARAWLPGVRVRFDERR